MQLYRDQALDSLSIDMTAFLDSRGEDTSAERNLNMEMQVLLASLTRFLREIRQWLQSFKL